MRPSVLSSGMKMRCTAKGRSLKNCHCHGSVGVGGYCGSFLLLVLGQSTLAICLRIACQSSATLFEKVEVDL